MLYQNEGNHLIQIIDHFSKGKKMPKLVNVKPQFPKKKWRNVSQDAQDLILKCLACDVTKRPSVVECLEHPWMMNFRK